MIAAVPAVHIALFNGQTADPVAWVMNVIMAGCAALLGVSLLRAPKKATATAPQPAE